MKKAVRVVLLVLVLSLIACGGATYDSRAEVFPIAGSDSLIIEAIKASDMIVLGMPDTMTPELLMEPSMDIGSSQAWQNIRISVDSLLKGKLSHAKYMDYGILPVWRVPPRPFKLTKNQIMVQTSNKWNTSPITVGTKAVFFLKKCWDCVELPASTSNRTFASPWFSILTLKPEQWGKVRELYGN